MFFDNITVTGIDLATVVTIEKGSIWHMDNRKWCGLSLAECGSLAYRCDGKEYRLDGAHAVFLPAGSTYSLECFESGRFPLINFYVKDGTAASEFYSLKLPDNTYLLHRHEELRRLFSIETAAGRAECLSIVYHMISRLAEFADPIYSPALAAAVAYIEAHYTSSELSNAAIAEAAHISEVYFRKLFKAAFGRSPGKYISELRINYAKKLLTSGAGVNDAALGAGYTNCYHFSRIFKEKLGVTPGEYRKGAYKIEM